MEEADKGWLMIRIGVNGWMFILVLLAHRGSRGQRAVKWLLFFPSSPSLLPVLLPGFELRKMKAGGQQ